MPQRQSSIVAPLEHALKRRSMASKRTTMYWLQQARQQSSKVVEGQALVAAREDEACVKTLEWIQLPRAAGAVVYLAVRQPAA